MCIFVLKYNRKQDFIIKKTKNMTNLIDDNMKFSEPTTTLRSVGIKWGGISGAVGIIIGLVFFMTGMVDYSGKNSNWLSTTVTYIAMGVCIYMALVEYKQTHSGYIRLGECIKIGLWLGLIAGVITAVYMMIFFKFIQPDLIETIMNTAIEQAQEQNPSVDEDEMRKMMGMFVSPIVFAISGLIGSVIINFIGSLLIGAAVKKEAPRF